MPVPVHSSLFDQQHSQAMLAVKPSASPRTCCFGTTLATCRPHPPQPHTVPAADGGPFLPSQLALSLPSASGKKIIWHPVLPSPSLQAYSFSKDDETSMYACAWGTDYEVEWCPGSDDKHTHTHDPKGGKGKDKQDDDEEQLQGSVAALVAAPPPPC